MMPSAFAIPFLIIIIMNFFSLFFLILFQFSFSLYIAHRIGCSAAPVKPSWKRVFHISMFIYMNISLSGEIPAIWSEKRAQLPRNILFFFLPLIDISDNNKTARKKNDNFQPLRGSQPWVVSCSKLSSRSWLGFLAEPQHPKPNPNPNSKKKKQQHRHQLQGPTFTTTTAYVTVGLIIIPQLILYALCTVLCVCLSFSVDFKYFHRFINIFGLTASSDWNWNSFFLYIDTPNS